MAILPSPVYAWNFVTISQTLANSSCDISNLSDNVRQFMFTVHCICYMAWMSVVHRLDSFSSYTKHFRANLCVSVLILISRCNNSLEKVNAGDINKCQGYVYFISRKTERVIIFSFGGNNNMAPNNCQRREYEPSCQWFGSYP